MLTDKFLEESGDEVSNDFSTLETLLLIWMGLRLRNLASLEDIEEEYPKWKNKACREFFEYSGTEFQKVKKSSQNKVKSAIKSGIAMTVSNIFSRLKDTDAQTSKKDMLNRSNKNLNKGIKDTQGEIKNLCNISRKCTNKQFIKACDEAYSKIVAGNNADKAIESSIRKLSQKGIEVVGYTDHTTSMDAAVKRAVTSGVNQTSLKFKMDNCKELGINIVKTSSHGGARPSHQEWQGKLFYLHTPVKGLQNFKKATGYGRVDGLGGANCRHSFYEVTDYEYKNNLVDTEEFDKNRNDDQYELEQKQRYYERQIRSWKKRKNILDECGVDSTKEAKKIREWQDKRSQFIKDSNIQFKKEHGIDNVLKKAYPREKVVKRPFFGEDSNGKIRKKINSAEYDGAPKIFDYSKEKEEKIIETFTKIDSLSLKDGYEYIAISNKKTGQQIGNLSTSSNKSHVNPSKEMYKIISEADENSLTMVHNHPKKSPPSVGDIISCNNNKAIGEMLVINSDGETYFFSIPKDARIDLSTEEARQELRSYFNAKRNWVASQYPDASENDIRHLTLKRISEEAGWNYGRKRTEKK
mgnify:FL=1|jgi:hypothetical protein